MTREGNRKPEILDTRLVAKSRLFGIEEMHLRFSNGVERTYELALIHLSDPTRPH